jgi:spore maturation protein CgeB
MEPALPSPDFVWHRAAYTWRMRVAVVGAGGAYKTEVSIMRAARTLGHPCRLVNVVGWSRYLGPLAGRAIRYLVDAFEPDFVLLTRHAMAAGEQTVRALVRNRDAAFWYFDPHPKPAVLALGRTVGRMYITYLAQVQDYRSAGIPEVRFLPQGVDPTTDYPVASAPPTYTCDVSFVGSGQYPYRHAVLSAIAKVCRLQIRGPNWHTMRHGLPIAGGAVRGQGLRQVVRGAAVSLGASAHPEQDADRASASNRMWKVMGCGGFYLGPYVRDIECFAESQRHCVWYQSIADAVDQVRHYLDAPSERLRIAREGREHALRKHTYARRLELLLAGREYELGPLTSDNGVVPKLEHPHTGQPLDHL